jgi:hypothetical protein
VRSMLPVGVLVENKWWMSAARALWKDSGTRRRATVGVVRHHDMSPAASGISRNSYICAVKEAEVCLIAFIRTGCGLVGGQPVRSRSRTPGQARVKRRQRVPHFCTIESWTLRAPPVD